MFRFCVSSTLSGKGNIEVELHVLLNGGVHIETKLSKNIISGLDVLHLVNSTGLVLVKVETLPTTLAVL